MFIIRINQKIFIYLYICYNIIKINLYFTFFNFSFQVNIQIYRSSYQKGFLSILYAVGEKPLQNWQVNLQDKEAKVQRQIDKQMKGNTIEIISNNSTTTFITCPAKKQQTLGIKLPYLVLILKNLNKFFSFEVEILDDKNIVRRFKSCNYIKKISVKPFVCNMPLQLGQDWNQLQINLADFTQKTYKTNFVECVRVTIHANCRLRRVYFCDQIYEENELPADYRMIPLEKKTEYGQINGVRGTFRMRVSKNLASSQNIQNSDLFEGSNNQQELQASQNLQGSGDLQDIQQQVEQVVQEQQMEKHTQSVQVIETSDQMTQTDHMEFQSVEQEQQEQVQQEQIQQEQQEQIQNPDEQALKEQIIMQQEQIQLEQQNLPEEQNQNEQIIPVQEKEKQQQIQQQIDDIEIDEIVNQIQQLDTDLYDVEQSIKTNQEDNDFIQVVPQPEQNQQQDEQKLDLDKNEEKQPQNNDLLEDEPIQLEIQQEQNQQKDIVEHELILN